MPPSPDRPPLIFRLLNKVNNPFMKALLRSPLHGVVSRSFLLITFTGRKSGKVYTTPVQYAERGDTVTVVTSAGYTWWKNLRGGAPVEVRLRGQQRRGTAEVTTDSTAVAAALAHLYPGFTPDRRASFMPGKVVITITCHAP